MTDERRSHSGIKIDDRGRGRYLDIPLACPRNRERYRQRVEPCPRMSFMSSVLQAKIDTSEQSRSRPTGGGSDVEAPYSCTESPTAPSCTAKIVSQQTENLCDTTSTMTLLAWTLLHYRPRHSASERKVNEKERDQNEECMRRIASGRCNGCRYGTAGARQSAGKRVLNRRSVARSVQWIGRRGLH